MSLSFTPRLAVPLLERHERNIAVAGRGITYQVFFVTCFLGFVAIPFLWRAKAPPEDREASLCLFSVGGWCHLRIS